MSEDYVLKQVQVTIEPNVVLIAEVGSIVALKKLLADLRAAQFKPTIPSTLKPDTPTAHAPSASDSPETRMETRAGIPAGSLRKSNVVAFKDNVPEILSPSSLTVTDAVLVLLFALETGLKNQKMQYEPFKALYEAQNIKSGSPLYVKFTDLRNSGYLDKKLYAADQSLRLTAKGEKKAIELLLRLTASGISG